MMHVSEFSRKMFPNFTKILFKENQATTALVKWKVKVF